LADAAFNVAHTALLIQALTGSPELLYEATADRLHQAYRANVMPKTVDFVDRLRDSGVAAVVSGAGPSVLALISDHQVQIHDIRKLCPDGWLMLQLNVDTAGAIVHTIQNPSRLEGESAASYPEAVPPLTSEAVLAGNSAGSG
jgi:homoserine kinase